MGKRLLLLGGGGHFHSVLDSILSMGLYDEIGIVDKKENSYLNIPFVGTDDDLPALLEKGWSDAFITVGSIEETTVRRKLYDLLKTNGFTIPSIIDPSAIIANSFEIKEGTFVGKRAVINTGAMVGICSIINTGTIIEHDCRVGDFVHVSPGATICGQVTIGNNSLVGAGSVVRQCINIGSNSLIGAGAVVVKDVPNDVKAFGNPCKVVE